MLSPKQVSLAIAQLMPHIIQGVHLDFLTSRSITQTQFLVLVAIHARTKCSMNVLASNMQVSMPTMSGIVDRLAKGKYLQRIEDPSDRRQVVVALTAKGKKVIEDFQAAVSARWQQVLQTLNQNELASFYQVISALSQRLQKR